MSAGLSPSFAKPTLMPEKSAGWTGPLGEAPGVADDQFVGENQCRGPPQKMLKMKIDPEMCMKTKDNATICPTQKTTFLPGCTPFYTETHVFCRNCRLFGRNSSAGD